MVYCIILHRDGYSGYPSSSSISQRCQHLLVSHSSTPWILFSFYHSTSLSTAPAVILCLFFSFFFFFFPVLIIPSCLHFKSFPVSVLLQAPIKSNCYCSYIITWQAFAPTHLNWQLSVWTPKPSWNSSHFRCVTCTLADMRTPSDV